MSRALTILMLICFLLNISNAYRILCLLPYPGKSHYMVFEPLLDELQKRGHNLTVVSFFPKTESVNNRRDVSLVGLAPISVEMIDLKELDNFFAFKYIEHVPLVTGLAKMNLKLCKTVLDSKVFEEFLKAEGDYDVILVEHFNSDCMMGVIYKYRLPSIGLMSSALLPWSPSRVGATDNPSYVPGMTLPLTDKMSFSERVVNTFFLFFYIYWYEIQIRWKEQELLEQKIGRKIPPLEEIARNTSIVLVNTHFTWNGVRNLPPSVVEVGGLHLHNRQVRSLPKDINTWVEEAKDGFIMMSFGSLVRGSSLPQKKLQAMMNVFARLPHRVIIKWETTIDGIPDNVRVMRWLPQYDLLNHPKCVAFITHAGLLSLTEAVSAGVPILALPILGDQFGNAAHAQSAGIAAVVRLIDVEEESFRIAMEKVLSPEMRSRAKLVSEMWKDRPASPMDTAVYYIERTARYKGLQMSCEARRLNRFQLALLDVYAFMTALAIVLGFILWKIFKATLFKLEFKNNYSTLKCAAK